MKVQESRGDRSSGMVVLLISSFGHYYNTRMSEFLLYKKRRTDRRFITPLCKDHLEKMYQKREMDESIIISRPEWKSLYAAFRVRLSDKTIDTVFLLKWMNITPVIL